MKWLVGTALLGSAFAPLVAVLALLRLEALGFVAWLLLALSLAFEAFLSLELRAVGRIQTHELEPASIKRADERVLAFTASYLVPVVVVAFGDENWSTTAATAGLVVLLCVVYVRGELYYLNPTLALAGYRLYELTDQQGRVQMLLSRQRHVAVTSPVEHRQLATDLLIQMEKPR